MPSSDESAGPPDVRPEQEIASRRAAHAVARAQHLVDSRPPGRYQLLWCQWAMHDGDMSVAALALSRMAESGFPSPG